MKARKVKKLDPTGTLADNAARIVRTRVRELIEISETALDESEVEAQHDLRIAAKRLRYVLELTGFALGRPAEIALRRTRELQEILGDMHDCDVMLPRVREHVQELQAEDGDVLRERAVTMEEVDPALAFEAPHRNEYEGLEILSVHLETRRRVKFDRFAEFWRRQDELGTWKRLEASAESQLERSRQERRARKEETEERPPDPSDGRSGPDDPLVP